ncbi:MAG TPA: NADH-quinone oxidoreductase subunit NuoG [Rickettsiales bacterium]|nr:NADH-quinone oxidoreductase subunit NuoG [Rickettsiales bacterium]
MTKLTIDGKEIEVPAGSSVIQACEAAGVEIPRFCYHERLKIAGNCRMCLVEVSPGPPKPQASCALPVAEGMNVKTNTPMVKKAREGVMEFLLINHPLDCPICDQGGECDLQDQAMGYGRGTSRYDENKRAVQDKYMGPLIKTQMTRCIHCTRCIRFSADVAGVPELGATGRGEHMEVGTYVEKALTSELSGNLVDICPVGALTSRPYAFTARPWELRKTESIDVMDAVGSNIRVDSRQNTVLRVLPRLNEEINEEWISDKTRHACDGLRTQRLDRPYVRRDGRLQEASWQEALAVVADRLHNTVPTKIAAIAGDQACVESMFALKALMTAIGSPHTDCRQDGAKIDVTDRASYLFNSTIAGIEQADVLLLVGTNPRHEATIINARIRKSYLQGKLKIYVIGDETDLTYKTEWLGNNPEILKEIASGKHPLSQKLKEASNPMIIVGQGALSRTDGEGILKVARYIADNFGLVKDGWNGFNVLHRAAARVGGLDTGFVPGPNGKDTHGILEAASRGGMDVVYLLGADEIPTEALGKAFVIYQGHHGDAGAHRADVVLPGSAYTEKNATYVNTEGFTQHTAQAVFPPGEAKEDWKIIRSLSEVLGRTLAFDTLEQLRALIPQAPQAVWQAGKGDANAGVTTTPFIYPVANYYMTDPISRASRTMAECVSVFLENGQKAA